MPGFFFHKNRWWCDQITINDLAAHYGTPLYIYSRERIVENFTHLVDAFKPLNARIHYSVKANSNGAILRLLRELGAGFDVVSGGELFRVLRSGADPAKIVFAGVGKTESELAYALDQQAGWINVESAQELDALDRLAATRSSSGAQGPAIALRVNPSVEAETHHHIATGGHRSKFGIDLAEAESVLTQADRFPHLDIAGLHLHIGSQLASPDRTREAVQRVLELTRFHSIRMLDIGGGFPVAYRPDDRFPEPAVFADALKPLLKDQSFEVAIEPGRSVVADAGALVVEVQYVKRREGRRIIVTDAGMTELIRPALYAAYHHIVAIDRPVITENAEEREGNSAPSTVDPWPADVVGPVCESADVLGKDRSLPEVHRGDRLLILTTGAYGSAMASNYNSRPRPAEVLVEGSAQRLIRRRETWEDLVRLEQ